MSVYTPVTSEELEAWLTRYAVGTMEQMQGIASGIENTNYFVTTGKGRYVLTLYERLPAAELPFYLNLMAHLAKAGVPVPAPEADRTGALFSLLNGKPASLVTRIDGHPVNVPTPQHCAEVGRALARMHIASATYRARLSNRRGPAWWRQAARAVKPFLNADQVALLDAELKFQTGFGRGKLPKGAIHGDLFCDNVLFHDGQVAGIIDFGFAATDFFAYDLAITVNDWCVADAGSKAIDAACAEALVTAYDAIRPLTPDERTAWPALLRAAGLRFWLSRLYDMHLPRPGELTHAHDPEHFERVLRDRATRPVRFPERAA